MKKLIFASLILLPVFFICGCGYWIAPVIPPQGAAFSQTKAPIDTDLNNTDLGSKTGKSSSVAVLGLVAFGDASTASAAQNGDIKIIKHVDYEYLNVLGLFQQFTLVVYGD